ncbi:hypothetical protein Y1Q_0014584 [Alligator mississippiensis]|uniref:Uncharacterized protein n=1 Tax=Alligator mississippiensis TaxID=8496 RepID=A0A151PDK1_ALLMI|nr:hypothetical protein Y1Q_0014584 [Alligator mississippiensis]
MESDKGVNEHLKLQFKALQELQQKRLQNLMEKKKEKKHGQKGNKNSPQETFGVQDDLDLFKVDGLKISHEDNSKSIGISNGEKEQQSKGL